MLNSYRKFWQDYFNFKGKTTRKDFWSALLIHLLFIFGLSIISILLNELASGVLPDGFNVLSLLVRSYLVLYLLLTMIPTLSVMTRRLADADLPWALIFLNLIPFVGAIILLILCAIDKDQSKPVTVHHSKRFFPYINEKGNVTFSEAIKNYVTGYFSFDGKTNLKSFLWAQLFFLGLGLIWIGLAFLAHAIEINRIGQTTILSQSMDFGVRCYFAFILVPELSVMTRRLNDVGIAKKETFLIFLTGYSIVSLHYAFSKVTELSYGFHQFVLAKYFLFLISMVLVFWLISLLLKNEKNQDQR